MKKRWVMEGDGARVNGRGKPMKLCMCVCFYKVWPCYMNPFSSYVPFVTGRSHRHAPVCQFSQTVNLLFFWLMTNLSAKSCAAGRIHEHPWTGMNTNTPLHTHLTSKTNFSLLEWKLWPPKEWKFFVDWPADWLTERPLELLVSAKNVCKGSKDLNYLVQRCRGGTR